MVQEVERIFGAPGVHAEKGKPPVERRLFQEHREDEQQVYPQYEAGDRHTYIGGD